MYDQLDERGVPISKGTPKAVRVAVVIGMCFIFGMGAITIAFSGYGHGWPMQKTLRIPLNSPITPNNEGQVRPGNP